MPHKVVIVEDNPDIRNRFVDLLGNQPDMICSGAYDNAEDFISEYVFLHPDVVFMDIQLPGMDGIECIRYVKKKNPSIHFISYTIFENSDSIFNAIKAGATGYLLKSTPGEKMIQAVKDIIKGESPMSGSVAMKVIKAFQVPFDKNETETLSERESQILNLLTKGFRYKDIACDLNISTETVRSHIRNIYEKLQVSSRTQAINKYQNPVLSEVEKYAGSAVKEADEEECFQRIKKLFEEEKVYLKEKLSISQLAAMSGFPVYVVSQTINRCFQLGFFDLVNHYRIQDAVALLKSTSDKISVEGIAYSCGFSSRTSFYNAFRKETGHAPGEIIPK